VRVRLFELRLLAVALTVLWAAGGGIVLIGYRPGGPWDLLVGVTAGMPLLVAVAPIVWPPLVTSNRGSAGVFWIGLIAGLMLVPSIASVAAQVLARSSEPLLPSAEVVYPWAVALIATSLFAGLGVSRQLINETGFGRKRLAASVGFALITTTIIGGAFAGVSLADNAALNDTPSVYSRFGPTSPSLTPPQCDQTLKPAPTAQLALSVWGNVDLRSIGTVDLTGQRSGENVDWTAQVVRSDLFGEFGAIRLGTAAWDLAPGKGWQSVPPASLDSDLVDAAAAAAALSPQNRATAEDHGIEYVEGRPGPPLPRRRRRRDVRRRRSRRSSGSSAMQSLATWRGEIDYWVFGDGEIGQITGTVRRRCPGDPAARLAGDGLGQAHGDSIGRAS
jgi:hypothetical protein